MHVEMFCIVLIWLLQICLYRSCASHLVALVALPLCVCVALLKLWGYWVGIHVLCFCVFMDADFTLLGADAGVVSQHLLCYLSII